MQLACRQLRSPLDMCAFLPSLAAPSLMVALQKELELAELARPPVGRAAGRQQGRRALWRHRQLHAAILPTRSTCRSLSSGVPALVALIRLCS
jgi:hypothetical protein